MTTPVPEQLRETALSLAGDEVHAITTYTNDGLTHEYLSDDLTDQIDQIVLDSLHRPVTNLHQTLRTVSRLNPIGGGHGGSVHFFEDVTYLHIPSTDDAGIIISLSPRSERYRELYRECRALVTD